MNPNPKYKSITLNRDEAQRIADGLHLWIGTITDTDAERRWTGKILDSICKQYGIDFCAYCELHQPAEGSFMDRDGDNCCDSCYRKHILKETTT